MPTNTLQLLVLMLVIIALYIYNIAIEPDYSNVANVVVDILFIIIRVRICCWLLLAVAIVVVKPPVLKWSFESAKRLNNSTKACCGWELPVGCYVSYTCLLANNLCRRFML